MNILSNLTNNYEPQIIILSTQRSGTHLLESFLKKLPEIKGNGELFYQLKEGKSIVPISKDKINVFILMYSELSYFYSCGNKLSEHFIIHLLRNPKQVALSRLQGSADKYVQGEKYKPHRHVGDEILPRGLPNLKKYNELIEEITIKQNNHRNLLRNINHLEIFYEDIVPDNTTVKYLNEKITRQILNFIGLENEFIPLHTTYIKTGINLHI